MTRTIRKLFAKTLTGTACLLPLGLPSAASAQIPVPATQVAAPVAAPMSSKQVHQYLARGSGWIQNKMPTGLSHGTGWILDLDKKLMVTNDHVVEGTDAVDVIFPMWKNGKLVTDETSYLSAPRVKAVVIDRDPHRDLALIRLESIPEGQHAIKLAAEEPDAGDDIRTIGGFTNGGDGLVWGAVSGVVRAAGPQNGRKVGPKVRHVLSNATTNGGNSGAAVVNMAGELVGVHSAAKLNATNVAMHVSVLELKAYAAEVVPLADPEAAKDYVTRGKRRQFAGRNDAAIADFTAALAIDDQMADALFFRGKANVARGNAKAGLDDMNAAVAIDKANYDYRIGRGIALRTAGKTDESVADFTAAIRTQPKRMTAYNERAITYFVARKFAEAEADYSRAIEISKTDAVLYGNRADARLSLKKYDAAAEDWKQAAKLAPWNADYPNGLGLTLLAAGNTKAAVDAFAQAVQVSRNHPFFLTNLGDALRKSGDFKAAVKAYSDAIRGWNPNALAVAVARSHAGRGIANRELKHYRDAIDDLTRAIDLTAGKNASYLMERGLAHKASGAETAANDDFAAANKIDPRLGKAVATVGKTDSKTEPKPTVKTVAAVNNGMVGTWRANFTLNGTRITQLITFKEDGTFDATQTFVSAFGTERVGESGTYTLANGKLTIRGKQFGTVVRTIEVNGDNAEVEMDEIGRTVTFSKVK